MASGSVPVSAIDTLAREAEQSGEPWRCLRASCQRTDGYEAPPIVDHVRPDGPPRMLCDSCKMPPQWALIYEAQDRRIRELEASVAELEAEVRRLGRIADDATGPDSYGGASGNNYGPSL
jgi:hypothetical protein